MSKNWRSVLTAEGRAVSAWTGDAVAGPLSRLSTLTIWPASSDRQRISWSSQAAHQSCEHAETREREDVLRAKRRQAKHRRQGRRRAEQHAKYDRDRVVNERENRAQILTRSSKEGTMPAVLMAPLYTANESRRKIGQLRGSGYSRSSPVFPRSAGPTIVAPYTSLAVKDHRLWERQQ